MTGHRWTGPGQAEPQVSFPPPVRPPSAATVSGTCDGLGWCVKRDAAPLGERYCNGAGRCVKGYAVVVGTTTDRPVTAPLPPDRADVLTRLEKLHKAATPGEWEVLGEEGIWAAVDFGGTFVTFAEDLAPADAAAIVAEHNAIPALLTAVRGVLARHSATGGPSGQVVCDHCSDPWPNGNQVTFPCPERAAVAAALGETGGGQ